MISEYHPSYYCVKSLYWQEDMCIFILYDVSVKSINCVCACTNKQFILIDMPNTENGIKWCEHAILWEFEVFEDCGNCIAMEQSGYISEWQNLFLTLASLYAIKTGGVYENRNYRR